MRNDCRPGAVLCIALLMCCVSATSNEVKLCSDVRRRCVFRTGCGLALGYYMDWCSEVTRGVSKCPEACQHALIALTSTEEGKELMDCTCDDRLCEETKQNVDICRSQVLKASQNETVSCRVSELICAADAQCFEALKHYRFLCKSMFKGKKCSNRCLNSINILKKHENSAKLSTCKCEGNEEYDCFQVQSNMARLCYKRKPSVDETNINRHDLRTNEVSRAGLVFSSKNTIVTVVFVFVIRLLVLQQILNQP